MQGLTSRRFVRSWSVSVSVNTEGRSQPIVSDGNQSELTKGLLLKET